MPAKEQMIVTGVEMFRREGYRACSWRKLVEASGAPWGSARHYFPGGKEQLGVAVLEHATQLGLNWIDRHFSGDATAGEALTGLLRDAAAHLQRDHYEAGCPVAIVTLERGSHSAELTAACAAAFSRWRTRIGQALQARGIAAEPADATALLTLVSFEGCLVVARATGNDQAFQLAQAPLLASLGQHVDARPHHSPTAD